MKNIIYISFLLLSVTALSQGVVGYSSGYDWRDDPYENVDSGISAGGIKDGWYEAEVNYFNPGTYVDNTYILNVKVESNRVIAISFGGGKSVHIGYNNSGYSYAGGKLKFSRNYEGIIYAASTSVNIIYSNNNYVTYNVGIH